MLSAACLAYSISASVLKVSTLRLSTSSDCVIFSLSSSIAAFVFSCSKQDICTINENIKLCVDLLYSDYALCLLNVCNEDINLVPTMDCSVMYEYDKFVSNYDGTFYVIFFVGIDSLFNTLCILYSSRHQNA